MEFELSLLLRLIDLEEEEEEEKWFIYRKMELQGCGVLSDALNQKSFINYFLLSRVSN